MIHNVKLQQKLNCEYGVTWRESSAWSILLINVDVASELEFDLPSLYTVSQKSNHIKQLLITFIVLDYYNILPGFMSSYWACVS